MLGLNLPSPPTLFPVGRGGKGGESLAPERLALIFGARAWTYAELEAEARALAARLAALGVGHGSRVAMLLPNVPQAVFLVHAVGLLGGVLVPLNTRLTSDELRFQVRRAAPALLAHNQATAPLAMSLAQDVPLLDLDAKPEAAPNAFKQARDGWTPTAHDVHTIVFTSGTTGRPKGALLTWGNHWWSAVASGWRLGVQPDDRWLLCLPLYHVGGLAVLLRSALYGTTVILHERFDPSAVIAALQAHRATVISLVPTLLKRLLEAGLDARTAPALRVALLGGAAAAPDLVAQACAAGIPVALTYGLTEAASQVATAPPQETREFPDSVGLPLQGVSVRIADEQGTALPPNEVGEIWVRGPNVMRGYLDDPEATAAALRGGWLRTGDLGFVDARGALHVVQRRVDLIVSGGENIYPSEVEHVLASYPGVEGVCVVGVPDVEWGQRVVALIQPAPGEQVDSPAVQAFCRQRLAGYKCPRQVLLVESLPLTASGKLDRRAAQTLATQLLAQREVDSSLTPAPLSLRERRWG
ncbi:MAG: o-succinylbenzoate--CoA ligase [Anaerolineae bacterium]|nr:o-succinylbenzoate--CoA ligase [Anaerolineae bacterium]